MRSSLLLASVIAASCDRLPLPPEEGPSASPLARAAPPPPSPQVAVPLHHHDFLRAHLAIDLPDGATPSELPWPTGGVLQAALRLARADEDLAVLVRAGDGVGLDEFRRDHQLGWTLSPEAPVTVCGRPARRMEAAHEEEHITCVMTTEGGHPAWIPPRLAAAVAFVHAGQPVLVQVAVESRAPDAYRDAVGRVLASIRCL